MKSLLAAAIAMTATAALATLPSAPAAAPRVDFSTTAIEGVPVVATVPTKERVVAMAPMDIVADRPNLTTASNADQVIAMPPLTILAERPTVATAQIELIALPTLHITARPQRTASSPPFPLPTI